MGMVDRFIYAALFFVLGWFGNAARERRMAPRGRKRAIPQGAATEKKPRAKKAKPEPPAPGARLPMD